ncbi:MAG: CAP domain-containing protein [Solirubrobacteraceae bacterium]|nr:CAP domain-containing protein [Solirubrobacteraceae bacterium]
MSHTLRRSRTTFAVAALAAATTLGLTAPAMAGDPVQSTTEGAFVKLLNAERAKQGLDPLRPAAILTEIADDYVAANVERDDISHEFDPPYIARARAAGCSEFSWSGPVLAQNSLGMTAAGALEQWLRSAGHRQVILDVDSNRIGVGIKGGHAVAFVLDCPASLADAKTAGAPDGDDDGGTGGETGTDSDVDRGTDSGDGGAGDGGGTGTGIGEGATRLPIKVGRPRARGRTVRIGIHVRSGKQRLRVELRRGNRLIRTGYRRLAKRERAYRVSVRAPAGRWRVVVRLRPAKGRTTVVKAGTVRVRR